MKTQRNLSGLYFRFFNPESKRMEDWCFEDLPEDEQDRILFNEDNIDWIKSLAKSLAIELYYIGEKFDIKSE